MIAAAVKQKSLVEMANYPHGVPVKIDLQKLLPVTDTCSCGIYIYIDSICTRCGKSLQQVIVDPTW